MADYGHLFGGAFFVPFLNVCHIKKYQSDDGGITDGAKKFFRFRSGKG